jgi:hypothetical protein
VIERLPSRAEPSLPRIWVSGRTPVASGTQLSGAEAGVAARAVGLAGAFAARVATASYSDKTLVFHLRSGAELLLGEAENVKLKVTVAEHALAVLPAGSTFLDVGTPGRPVSGTGSPLITTAPKSSSGG